MCEWDLMGDDAGGWNGMGGMGGRGLWWYEYC